MGLCGWAPRWQGDRELAYRIAGQSGTAVPGEAISIDTMERVPVTVGERGVHAWTDDEDRAWLRRDGRTLPVSPEGARVMMPAIAGDARRDVGAERGRAGVPHRRRHDRANRRWTSEHRSRRALARDRAHRGRRPRATRSDLWIVDLRDRATAPLVVSDAALERAPSLSRIDGSGRGTLAYLSDGALVVRTIELRR